ncbi:MAG TPA: phosphoenolpyruvate carboxykinase domain-containing protein, partial [Acidimicrobiales bacterium]|nr:phosphoenolpyruvate carboxykinase domain-containing protein [Acidimicrobiales bacterium]
IFYVNWFRKDTDGKWLWPGYGENSRVLEWVFQRCAGEGGAVETAIGYVPTPESLPTDGLDVSAADLAQLLEVDIDEWRREISSIEQHFATFGDRLPGALRDELAALEKRLGDG